MIQIKAASRGALQRAVVLKTYTFFLRGALDASPFEPVLCRSDAEAMVRAHELLERHPGCEAIDVCFGDQHLFRVASK